MSLLRNIFRRTRSESPEFRALVDQSLEELRLKTAAHDAGWRLGEADWSVNQDAGTIVFSRADGVTATCPVQIIGTFNTGDGTWLWGWDHPSVHPPLQDHARRVRDYGETHGLARLTTQKLRATEAECWEFAALACKLCDAQGAYRGPAGSARVFMTFGTVTLGSRPQPPEPPRPTTHSGLPRPARSEQCRTPESDADPEAAVRGFIRALWDWEVQAYARSREQGVEAHEAIKQDYLALLHEWCGPGVAPRMSAIGNNPHHHPEAEAITSTTIDGDQAVVTTRHVGASDFVTEYEYHLRCTEGRWLVTSLLYVGEEEKFEMFRSAP